MGRYMSFISPLVVASCLALALYLSSVTGFVPPASRARFPFKAREVRGTTSVGALSSVDGATVVVAVASSGGMEVPGATIELVAVAAPSDTYLATGLFSIAAAVLVVGAGLLVASTVSGKDGLGAFLSKEKANNPFYQNTMSKIAPRTPDVLNKIRFPDLDFVEVYNQPPRAEEFLADGTDNPDASAVVATAESLRQRLLEAVQAKDYNLASSLERELASFLRQNKINFEDDAAK